MRSNIIGILACLTLITLSATVTMAGLTDGLVAYWPLDEGEGITTADLSGNENDGTLDLPEWDDSGKFGSALNFDGIDDYVDCGNPDILDFGTGDFTVSAWIKTSVFRNMTIFGNGGDDGGGIRYRLGTVDEGGHWLFDDNTAKFSRIIPLVAGEWNHIVAMRRDGTGMCVYANGVEGALSQIPAGYDLSGTSQRNALIGAIWSEARNVILKFFAGLIDDVALWNRAITEEEIAELATGSIPTAVEPNGKLAITWSSIKN